MLYILIISEKKKRERKNKRNEWMNVSKGKMYTMVTISVDCAIMSKYILEAESFGLLLI